MMKLNSRFSYLKTRRQTPWAFVVHRDTSIEHQEKGYSLMETIVVVALFAMASLTIMGTILFLYRTNANAIEQAFALQSARKGVELMVRDVREAAYGDEGSYPLVDFSTTSLTFFSDTDQDESVERIRYFLQGSTLYRGVVQATGTPATYATSTEEIAAVSEHVRNTDQGVDTFTYYNASGTVVTTQTDMLDIRFITINLVVNINPSRLPEEFTLRSSATMRNLKDNL